MEVKFNFINNPYLFLNQNVTGRIMAFLEAHVHGVAVDFKPARLAVSLYFHIVLGSITRF